MYIFSVSIKNYPSKNWNYIGEHESILYDFVLSEFIIFLFTGFVTFLIYLFYLIIPNIVSLSKTRFVFERLNLDDTKRYIFYLFILYVLASTIARINGVDVTYQKELLTGKFRELIFFLYRSFFPILILINIMLLKKVDKLSMFIYFTCMLLISLITASRVPFILISAALIYNLFLKNIRILNLYFIISASCLFLISFFSITILRGMILNPQSDVTLDNFGKEIFNYAFFTITKSPYDFITLLLSRISSHTDLLLATRWNLNFNESIYIILNKLLGCQFSWCNIFSSNVTYNFPEQMKLLYGFDAGPYEMPAPNLPGLLVALFRSGYSICLITTVVLSAIVLIINFSAWYLKNIFNFNTIELDIIKIYLFILWLWVSPKVAIESIITINIFCLYFDLKYHFLKNY